MGFIYIPVRAARARHVLTMGKKNTVVIKINSRFYLYYKTKI